MLSTPAPAKVNGTSADQTVNGESEVITACCTGNRKKSQGSFPLIFALTSSFHPCNDSSFYFAGKMETFGL